MFEIVKELGPVRPENSELFADLTFLGSLLMLDWYASPSSDMPV